MQNSYNMVSKMEIVVSLSSWHSQLLLDLCSLLPHEKKNQYTLETELILLTAAFLLQSVIPQVTERPKTSF